MNSLRELLPGRRRRLNQALLVAVGDGHVEEARRLLDAGADVNARDGFDSALGRAGRSPHSNAAVVRLLLDRGATVCPATDGPVTPPLLRASHLSDKERIRLLLEHGDPNVNDGGGTGLTVLQGLATWADAETIHFAIDHGADVSLRSLVNGRTALHTAAAAANVEALVALLARGADVQTRDRQGRTPLAHAEQMHTRLPSGHAKADGAYTEIIALLKNAKER